MKAIIPIFLVCVLTGCEKREGVLSGGLLDGCKREIGSYWYEGTFRHAEKAFPRPQLKEGYLGIDSIPCMHFAKLSWKFHTCSWENGSNEHGRSEIW